MANVKNYNEQGGARTVIGGSLDVASGGDLDIESGGALKIAGTQVTASAAELNYLDNSSLAAADLTKLATLTANATELNILDGVTSNASELNELDGGLFRASFTVGTENTTTGKIGVDVQLADAKNAALAHRAGVYIYLSGDANGDSLVSAAVDTLAAGTDGLYIAGVAGKSGHFISESDGDIDVSVTTSATGTMYMAVLLPDGTLATSTAITFA